MSPTDLVLERLASIGRPAKRQQAGWVARCPAHDDSSPSLSITNGRDDNTVLYCHAGCELSSILIALDLVPADLFTPKERKSSELGEAVAQYVYETGDGTPALRVTRHFPKTFRQSHWDGQRWVSGAGGRGNLLYKLPDVLAAASFGETIWVAEGEKDVEALSAAGVIATCNATGAGKFRDHHAEQLTGAGLVIIVCDRDKPGVNHARQVAAALKFADVESRIVLPVEGKDAADHIKAGHGIDEFVTATDEALDEIAGIDEETTATVLELPDAPQPLESSHRSGPAFPLETLPPWIADQCREVASAFQVPADLPAMLALGSLATILTGHVKVNLTGSKWTEHVNLYLVSALLPGSGKSPVFKAMTKPVNEVEKASLASAKDRLREYALRKRILEGQAKTKEAEAIKATDNSGMAFQELLEITKTLEDLPMPGAGRLTAEDITPEALVEALFANEGRISLMSSEGGVFDMMAGQYVDKGKATNLAVYLQGWSADPIKRQRTKGAEIVVDQALINMCVTTQPGVIGALGANRELVTKGVPVRFMYSVPPSLVGYRDRQKVFQSLDGEIDTRYQAKMTAIGVDQLGTEPVTLQLDQEATERFALWDQQLENRQRPGGDLADRAEWAAKLRATVLRVSAILHVAAAGQGDIGIERIEDAFTMSDYWLAHANVVEAMWADDHITSRARAIVRWAIETGKHQFSLRDVTSKRATFPTAEDAVAPLQELIDKGWVVAEQAGPVEVTGRGVQSQRFCLRSDADEWLRATAQPAQPPESVEVARVARVARKGEVLTPSLSTHNIHPPETLRTPAQPAQPAQLAPTGTDDFYDFEPI